jgi:hypothetical protein
MVTEGDRKLNEQFLISEAVFQRAHDRLEENNLYRLYLTSQTE